MISVIVPSRNRPNELLTSLTSLGLAEHGMEALVWLDDDDPSLARYKELFKSNPNVTLFIKKRVGYIKFHLMLNFLSSQAKYDWVFEFNDDAYMINPNWFDLFKDFIKEFDPTSQPVVINIWGQGETELNLFPIVSRKYLDILGHFALYPACDDWTRYVAAGAGISYDLKGIKPKHRKYGGENPLKDKIYEEVQADRAQIKKNDPLNNPLLSEDIEKIKIYLSKKI